MAEMEKNGLSMESAIDLENVWSVLVFCKRQACTFALNELAHRLPSFSENFSTGV
jgi:hypothetical protein